VPTNFFDAGLDADELRLRPGGAGPLVVAGAGVLDGGLDAAAAGRPPAGAGRGADCVLKLKSATRPRTVPMTAKKMRFTSALEGERFVVDVAGRDLGAT
jgi:hypothetical protein